MEYLVKILSVVLVLVKYSRGEVQSDVFEVRIFTHHITNNNSKAAILVKMYGSVRDTVQCSFPSTSDLPEATSQFGKMGLDVYNVTVTPAIGSPTKLRVTQEDYLKQMSWNLNKVLVIDSKAFYYEFLFDEWLNSSSTAEGVLSKEVSLSRKYGGPNSVQSRGCIGNGSQVWYLDNLNVYKPATVVSLSASNATLITFSGHTVTVPRDQHYDGFSRPLVVNDDWLKLTMSLNHRFIAAYNRSNEFYFGWSTYVSSKSMTTMMSNERYNWQHIMFRISYADSIAENFVRGGNIRKVNQMSTSFCTDHEPDEPDDLQAVDVLFTCENSNKKIVGHVIASRTARNLMHCGMICSRHAQCLSFNFCDSSYGSCKSLPSNCELHDFKNGRKSDEEKGFRFCVLLRDL